MQRATASSSTRSTSTSELPSKRRRVDVQSQPATPTPSDRSAHNTVLSPALKAEQDHRSQVRPRSVREGDETEWVLNISLPQNRDHQSLLVNRYQHDDEAQEDEDDIWASHSIGRQTYGSFKRKKGQVTVTSAAVAEDDLSPASDTGTPTTSSKLATVHHQDRSQERTLLTKPTLPQKHSFPGQGRTTASPRKNRTPSKKSQNQGKHHKKPRTTI